MSVLEDLLAEQLRVEGIEFRKTINSLPNSARKIYRDKFWASKINQVSHLYDDLGWTQKQIANYFCVGQMTISTLMRNRGLIERPHRISGQHKNICEVCGKEFFTYHSTKRKYCSTECWMAHHTKDKLVTRTCKYCGKKFQVYVFEIEKDGRGVHCSRSCFLKDIKKTTVTSNCLLCGKEVTASKSKREGNRGKFCSRTCSSTWRMMNTEGNYSKRSRSGRRADLDNKYFRSSWEANYARYLNWLIQQGEILFWEYEVDTFQFPVKRGNMTYLPDFKITNKDNTIEYHEVKGYMDKDSATKLKRMAKYYPDVKLVLIDRDIYSKLRIDLCHLIPNWEEAKR